VRSMGWGGAEAPGMRRRERQALPATGGTGLPRSLTGSRTD
jgi:hypothetical protein